MLRRAIDHAKSQRWTAIAIDFAVVAGMLIGLRADKQDEACRDGRV